MSKIIAMIGISGSGKSTAAKQLQEENPGSIIVNRDKLRELLYGYTEKSVVDHYSHPDFSKREAEVSKVQNRLIQGALLDGKVVIVDNTNLKLRFLNEYKKFGVPVESKFVDTNYVTCLERDENRERQVGKRVIDRQWQDLQNLKKVFDFKPWYPTTFKKPAHDKNKENCVIFDVDGTLADHSGVRGPFQWDKVIGDKLKEDIASLYMLIKYHSWHHGGSPKVIICSGRDGICKQETIEWLHYYGLTFDELYIRKQGDQRPDYEIKEEFWQEISSKYNVVFMVDDRQQVVDHGRRLGFTVLQVDYGDF